MIAPNVIDITGPISGDTNIAAVIFGALFSIRPNAANELCRWFTNANNNQFEFNEKAKKNCSKATVINKVQNGNYSLGCHNQ